LGQFNPSTRNQINRTFNEPAIEFKNGDDCFDDAYSLYKYFEYSQGRVPFPKKEMMHFKPFLAYYEGRPVSLVFCLDQFPFLRARSICSIRLKAEDKALYRWIACASRRLIYEICRYGQEKKYKWLDMGSINLEAGEKSGIAGFKASFHGEIIDEYTYFYKSRVFGIFEKFVKIKLTIYKLFKI